MSDSSDNTSSEGAAGSLDEALAGLRGAVDVLVGWGWSDETGPALTDAVVAMATEQARLRVPEAQALVALDTDPGWGVEGFRTVSSKVAFEINESPRRSKRRVRDAKKLDQLPELTSALATGAVTEDAAVALLRADTDAVHDQFAEHEKLLVDIAERLEFTRFEQALGYWSQLAAPDAADEAAAEAEKNRCVHASPTLGGRVRLDGWLTQMGGAEFCAELDRLEQQLFEADWAQAREIHGELANQSNLARNAGQRRHDALIEMSRRSSTNQAEGPAPRGKAVVTLHMDYETFSAELARHTGNDQIPYPADRMCELDNGTIVTPSEALNAALGGEVRRIVFDAAGEIIDFGRTRRLFTRTMAEAIGAKDRECFADGCHLPPTKCQIDHQTEWHEQGCTDCRNGQLGCRFHNLWKHLNPTAYRTRKRRHYDRFGWNHPPPQRE